LKVFTPVLEVTSKGIHLILLVGNTKRISSRCSPSDSECEINPVLPYVYYQEAYQGVNGVCTEVEDDKFELEGLDEKDIEKLI
jgi:hypothetical protein